MNNTNKNPSFLRTDFRLGTTLKMEPVEKTDFLYYLTIHRYFQYPTALAASASAKAFTMSDDLFLIIDLQNIFHYNLQANFL